jgi:hypothetical protein
MQSDLHKIIVSPQPLSSDHVKVFLYQILRGKIFLYEKGNVMVYVKLFAFHLNFNLIFQGFFLSNSNEIYFITICIAY